MKEILSKLLQHQTLSFQEAKETLTHIALGRYNESQVAVFISAYLMRSITIEELNGFREGLIAISLPFDPNKRLNSQAPIDIVGTGGDLKNSFNISTAASFVVAGAGYKVVKHGNYGATAISGASNVLEECGVKFSSDVAILEESLTRANIAYLHAPLFNPALKWVAPIRKQIGIRTFFNILGPLVNPINPPFQLLGVYNLQMARLYQYWYQKTDINFSIVHNLDGYDEISLTDKFVLITNQGQRTINPIDLGFPLLSQEALLGGVTLSEAKQIFTNVLSNNSTQGQENAVVINAAYAIQLMSPNKNIQECIAQARESIKSGKAKEKFKMFITINQ